MALGRDRREGRGISRLLRGSLAVAVLVAIGLFAFQLGVEDERGKHGRMAEELARAIEASQGLVDANTRLRGDLDAARQRLTELERRASQLAFSEAARGLLPLIEERLAGGVDGKRIAAAIEMADKPRHCEPPEVKRFLLKTTLTAEGPATSVGFANGMVTFSGQGVAAKNAEGRIEAWFDPAEPVAIRLTSIGGKTTDIAGKLPLHQTVRINDVEHRFTIMAGARGFVQITGDRCKVP
jgi:hypothetical protein